MGISLIRVPSAGYGILATSASPGGQAHAEVPGAGPVPHIPARAQSQLGSFCATATSGTTRSQEKERNH